MRVFFRRKEPRSQWCGCGSAAVRDGGTTNHCAPRLHATARSAHLSSLPRSFAIDLDMIYHVDDHDDTLHDMMLHTHIDNTLNHLLQHHSGNFSSPC